MTIRIGITGPIGCGKSTVSGWLAEHGAVVIDADRTRHDVIQPASRRSWRPRASAIGTAADGSSIGQAG